MKRVVPLVCLAIGLAGTVGSAEPAANGPPSECSVPRSTIPQDLRDWRVAVSVSAQPHYARPRIEVANSGRLTVKQPAVPDSAIELDKHVTETLIEYVSGFANEFYLCDPGNLTDRRDDLKAYVLEVASGGRAIEFSFDQAQPSRMRLESQAVTILDIVNRGVIHTQGAQYMLPEPLRSDKAGRDPPIAGGASLAPRVLPVDARFGVRTGDHSRVTGFSVSRNDASDNPYVLAVRHDEQSSVTPLSRDQAQKIYDGLRTVLCEFKLQGNSRKLAPATDNQVEVNIGAGGRAILTRFDDADDMPANSRAGLSQALDLVNAHVKPGYTKIGLKPRTNRD